MSDNVPLTGFEKLARSFSRAKLLRYLSLPTKCPRVEDVKDLRPLNTSVQSALAVHKSHVPLLGKIPGKNGVCSGAKLFRHNRLTVGVPCSSTEISPESGFCCHCEQLFLDGFDEDGFTNMDEDSMPETFDYYAAGKSCVLWNTPPVVHASDLFSGQVQEVKDRMVLRDAELHRDWPETTFKTVASSLLVGAGILYDDAGRAQNPYKRSALEQVSIGKYLSELIGH